MKLIDCLIDWWIVLDFTSYRQYSSHVTRPDEIKTELSYHNTGMFLSNSLMKSRGLVEFTANKI